MSVRPQKKLWRCSVTAHHIRVSLQAALFRCTYQRKPCRLQCKRGAITCRSGGLSLPSQYSSNECPGAFCTTQWRCRRACARDDAWSREPSQNRTFEAASKLRDIWGFCHLSTALTGCLRDGFVEACLTSRLDL